MKLYKILLLSLAIFTVSNQANAAFPEDFSDVIFLHADISSWPATATLNDVSNVGYQGISLPYSHAQIWPSRNHPLCSGCNANPWIFVKFGNVWEGATFEWFRFGQYLKTNDVVNGGHIKTGSFGTTWSPVVGEVYGFAVAGFSRFSQSDGIFSAVERTNICMFRWGVGLISCDGTPPVDPEPEIPNLSPVISLLLEEETPPAPQ